MQEDVVDVLVAVRLVAGERPLEATHADRGPEIPTAILRVDEEFELLRPPGTRVGNRRSRFRNVGRRAAQDASLHDHNVRASGENLGTMEPPHVADKNA